MIKTPEGIFSTSSYFTNGPNKIVIHSTMLERAARELFGPINKLGRKYIVVNTALV